MKKKPLVIRTSICLALGLTGCVAEPSTDSLAQALDTAPDTTLSRLPLERDTGIFYGFVAVMTRQERELSVAEHRR